MKVLYTLVANWVCELSSQLPFPSSERLTFVLSLVERGNQMHARVKVLPPTYKKIIRSNNSYNPTTKIKKPIKKWAKGMNRHFSEDDIQMPQQAHEKIFIVFSH